MAFKSFLGADDWQQAKELLTPPLVMPDGNVRQAFYFSNDNFSLWLGQKLEEKIKQFPDWRKTHPITLGSWARSELCPKSDIDMLFCGEEAVVLDLINSLQEQGFKLRYRMPSDPLDWTSNVEIFDVLALLKAKPWTSEGAQRLFEQQKKIWAQKSHFRRETLKTVKAERKARAERFDSITNYLEPHIKFGPGGLRDLEQGLQIYQLFSEKFTNPGHALDVLNYYRSFFLSIRQKLHIEGQGDVLSGSTQFDVAQWMGYSTQKDFMRELERGLSRVHFFSDWIVDVAGSTEIDLKKTEQVHLRSPSDLLKALKKSPRLIVQKKVRESLDSVFSESASRSLDNQRRLILEDLLDIKSADAVLVASFRSRMIDKLVPEIQRLVGYVQHDQYHRFTADTHIMQACREVKRIFKKSKDLGVLQKFCKNLKPLDWKIISWTCLYHDLAKGLGAGELHGDLGTHIVDRDFKQFELNKTFTEEVKWMVENHLELSQAAFRKNPRDPQLWQELKEKGIHGSRLYRLVIFTAIDIRATNPEAWNDWKAKLLHDLVVSLESQKAHNFFEFQKQISKRKIEFPLDFLERLSPDLLENLGAAKLAEDLELILKRTHLLPAIYKAKNNDIWIRFFNSVDRAGLLKEYVQVLYSLGLGVRHAAIHTIPKFGVYDWFQLSTQKDMKQIKLLLEKNTALNLKPLPVIHFESVDLVSATQDEWVIVFKALDQSGLLAKASSSLAELGMSILSARVHTWGRKVEDVFVLKALPDKSAKDILEKLNQGLVQ